MTPRLPRVLTIAGSDSGGGAGIQADLKTFGAWGTWGMSALTAVTAQNTVAVTAVHAVPPATIEAQIDAVFADLGVDAVKIGMVGDVPAISAVARALRRHRPRHVVLDPVMVASSGASLLADDAVTRLIEELFPLATVVTPNLPEAERLCGMALAGKVNTEAYGAAARRVREMAGRDEPPAVLIKGGHGDEAEILDVLFDGAEFHHFRHPRLAGGSVHGSGCALSAAIAARLAAGIALSQAVSESIEFLQQAILSAPSIGAGDRPVQPLFQCLDAVKGAVKGDR